MSKPKGYITVVTSPSGASGYYHGVVTVHDVTKGDAEEALQAFLGKCGVAHGFEEAYAYRKSDMLHGVKLFGVALGFFELATKAQADKVRKAADVGIVVRGKNTLQDLRHYKHTAGKEPLEAPTEEIYEKAGVEKYAAEKFATGVWEPAAKIKAEVERLLDAENAKRSTHWKPGFDLAKALGK